MKPAQKALTVAQKTLKREVAIAALVFWAYVVARTLEASFNQDVTQGIEIIKIITIPVWGYSTAAFGVDWYSKQLQKE